MNQPRRINKKHLLVFNNNGVISATTPKDWARGNQECFPDFNFTDSDNTPTVETIERFLDQNRGFHRIANDEIIIYYQYLAI